MSYNLILNSALEDTTNWKLINCTLDHNILTSNKKVFGIEQELILPDPTKIYFRVNYKVLSPIKEVKLGIQNGKVLGINRQIPRLNKLHKISLIDIAKQEKIKLHIIFESDKEVNKVLLQEPILVDLNHQKKSTWIKSILDKVLKYRIGYEYTNIYNEKEITKDIEDFKDINLEKAKIGSILSTKENIGINLNAKFIKEHYYLAKLDFEEINRFGNIYFKYGFIKSKRETSDQIYLLFRANEKDNLELIIESNDVFNYELNLKHLLIIDVTKMNLLKEDIPYLPFI